MVSLKFRRFALVALVVACLTLVARSEPPEVAPPPRVPARVALTTETAASIRTGAAKLDYTVTTGRLPVMDRSGKAKGEIFFTAYTVKGDKAKRPLTFLFNGGPGSSSYYVHLLAFGPRKLATEDDGKGIPKPAKLVENPYTLLDATDMVFIDPVSTGFSRSEKEDEAKMFHGLEEDCTSVGDFIRGYVAKFGREKSPTFIAGESYGTLRSAALAHYLQGKGRDEVKIKGIVLISTVLDYATISFGPGNDLPPVLFLPGYTAAALHHKKIEGDPAKLLPEVEKFAEGEYTDALKKGKDLPEDDKKAIAKTLAKYTGLTDEYVLKTNLRINAGSFRSELLRNEKEVIGRYDARVKAKTNAGGKGGGLSDPSSTLISPPLGECTTSYWADDLKIKTDLKYNFSGRVNPWNFGQNRGKATVVPRLREAMEKDTNLKVFVACGYCDLATPYLGAKWTMKNLGGPKELQDRIRFGYYEGGHMMYTVKESHARLIEDMTKFITAGEGEK